MENKSKSEMEEKLEIEHEEEIEEFESDEVIVSSLDRKSCGDLVSCTKQNDFKSSTAKESKYRDEKAGEVTDIHISTEERLMTTGLDNEDKDSSSNIDIDRHEEKYLEKEETLHRKSEISDFDSTITKTKSDFKNTEDEKVEGISSKIVVTHEESKGDEYYETKEALHRKSEIAAFDSTITKTKTDSKYTEDEKSEKISSKMAVTDEESINDDYIWDEYSPPTFSYTALKNSEKRKEMSDGLVKSKESVKERESMQCLNTDTSKRCEQEMGFTGNRESENASPEIKIEDEKCLSKKTNVLKQTVNIQDSCKDIPEHRQDVMFEKGLSNLSIEMRQKESCANLRQETLRDDLNSKNTSHSSKEASSHSVEKQFSKNIEDSLKFFTSKLQSQKPDEFYKAFSFNSKFAASKDSEKCVTKKEICSENNTSNLIVPSKALGTFSDHYCTYCGLTSELYNVCEDCMVYFCNNCFLRFHPRNHTICKSKQFSSFACSEHKQIGRYFCQVCKALKCEECVLGEGRCHGHKIKKLLKHITEEKDSYDEAINNFSNISSQTINLLSAELDMIEQNIAINALQRKESLRQELASLRHMITVREQEMYQDLEQDCRLQLKLIRQRRREYGSYLTEDNDLLSKSLHTLGTKSLLNFHFSVPKLWERFEQHKRNLHSLKSPDELYVSTLTFPFSLYVEKKELDKSLQLKSLASSKISCPCHTVYLDNVTRPLRLQELVVVHPSTLSNFQTIFVEIRKPLQNVLWKSECNGDDFIVNAEGRITLEPRNRYIVKISVQTTTQWSEYRTTQSKDRACHILLITGNDPPMDTRIDSVFSQQHIVGLHSPGTYERIIIKLSLFNSYGRYMNNPFEPVDVKDMSFEERKFFFTYCFKTPTTPTTIGAKSRPKRVPVSSKKVLKNEET